MMPQRIQLSRARGWRKPEDAIVVARPSRWGNPFRRDEPVARDDPRFPYLIPPTTEQRLAARLQSYPSLVMLSSAEVVEAYHLWLHDQPELMAAAEAELRGHDLACWCPLNLPCHADVLLELTNGQRDTDSATLE